jgi:uncharacterized membrane protein YdbT with pleckstrin-like domain
MSFRTWADSKVKKLNWADVALVKLSCIAFGIMLAALIPSLIEINIWWIVAVVILLAIKPTYKAYRK